MFLRSAAAMALAGFAGQAQPEIPYRRGSVGRPDGAMIAYYVREGSGPSLVLIPGSWGDHRVFDRFTAALAPSLRVIVVELRGHGASRPATLDPSMELFAGDVLAVIDALRLRRFYVGGHSIGGMLAIEIAGRRPREVAGAIPMEGWTHHRVQAEAFGGSPAKLTAEEEARNNANRARLQGTLTKEEIAAFGSVWRRWDGLRILEETPVPFLSIWGDRGRPRPSRVQLRIPDRPNLRLVWMEGASHSLLVQCPEKVAAAVNGFIGEIEARRMFDEPELTIRDDGADFSRLPRLPAEAVTVYRGEDGSTGFNMHPYLAWFGGRFWAIWSSNRVRDLQAGQYVRYSTSLDGIHWTPSAMLTPSEEKENFRYFARGLWVRDGELIALAARDEAVRPLFGPGLELRGYRWIEAQRRWSGPFTVAVDTINNFAPEHLPSGEWMMSRRDHRMRSSLLAGGVDSPSTWRVIEVPAPETPTVLDEPTWWTTASGRLCLAFRDGGKSRRLYRAFSDDGGKTWTQPVRTDFPDAMAKFNVLRLRNGLYVMASNPNPTGVRIPLCLSLSADGVVFTRMAVLRDAPTMYRYGGKSPGYAGYHYPQLLEHGGFLYVIHAENMEDIVLLRVPVAAIEAIAEPGQRW